MESAMTVDEMLVEARYQFYARTEQRHTPLPPDEGAAQMYAEAVQAMQPSRPGGVMPAHHDQAVARPVSAWCDWINSYRETLDPHERRRRLEAWRQAERQASLQA